MHDCKCECKHKKVRYCSKCQKVHCIDCGKEWHEQTTVWYHPNSYSYTYVDGIEWGKQQPVITDTAAITTYPESTDGKNHICN